MARSSRGPRTLKPRRGSHSNFRRNIVGAAARLTARAIKNYARGTSTKTTQTKRSKKSGKFSYTRGYYRGKFKTRKGLNYGYQKFLKFGTVIKHSTAFTQAGVENIWVGHGMSAEYFVTAVWQAIIIKLFRKDGMKVRSMQDRMHSDDTSIIYSDSPGLLRLIFKQSSSAAASNDIAIPANASYAEIAISLRIWMFDKSSTFFNDDNTLKEILFYRNESTTPAVYATVPCVRLDLENLVLDCAHTSAMLIQNRTLASGVGDESNMLDVSANPLSGRVYHANGNGLKARSNDYSSSGFNAIGTNRSGIISKTVFMDPVLGNDDPDNPFLRACAPSCFTNCKSSNKIMLAPGEIRKSHTSYTKTMSFTNFMKMFRDIIDEVDDFDLNSKLVYNPKMGKVALFCFEKMVKVGTEPDITVACEINDEYRVVARSNMPHLLPSVIVD